MRSKRTAGPDVHRLTTDAVPSRRSRELQRGGCDFLRKGVEVVKNKVSELMDEGEPIGKEAVCLLSSQVLQHSSAGVLRSCQ